jgi:hypothetical protein
LLGSVQPEGGASKSEVSAGEREIGGGAARGRRAVRPGENRVGLTPTEQEQDRYE